MLFTHDKEAGVGVEVATLSLSWKSLCKRDARHKFQLEGLNLAKLLAQ